MPRRARPPTQAPGRYRAPALEKGLEGTYNAASSQNVTLGELARCLGKTVSFGTHRYEAGTIDNARIAAACPAFGRSSLDAVQRFVRARDGRAALPEP